MAGRGQDELAELRLQLEQLRRECERSAAMTAEIIEAFGETFRRERRALQKAAGAEQIDPVSLDQGRAVLPLGVKEQRVRVGAAATTRRVTATALCADSSGVQVMRLTFDAANAPCFRNVAGERADEPGVEGASVLVRLIAGEAKELFELPPIEAPIEFAFSRVGGEPCLVRLQMVEETGAAISTSTRARCASARSSSPGGGRVSGKGALWKAQALMREGRADRAMEVALAYASDVERPALALLRATLAQDDDEWVANVNAYLEPFGVAPIRLEHTDAPRFFRLAADAAPAASGGPLVSVIMPAYNAEGTLELAAASILNQTWPEIELIIVDDWSSDTTWEIARKLAETDPRVRVRRNNVNVGPYVSKNLALATVHGDFITCHDADDWAHPQRIETQVNAIVANGDRTRACVSSWLRLDEAGHFCGFTAIGRHSHDGALRVAHVTCMIEADFMRRYVGHWDSVRFGADGEMLERLERLLGENLLRLRHVSTFSLDVPRSLTNDVVHGISSYSGLSSTRRAYRDAWRQWHATVTSDSAYVDFPQARRPFIAPDACLVRVAEAVVPANE